MATHLMTPAQFVEKWKAVDLPERGASQEHFIDLCRLLGQPTPAEHDATGAEYAFEKGVAVTEGASKGARGDRGFADAWWRGKFAWEYKRKDKYKDLSEAYKQLCQYREARTRRFHLGHRTLASIYLNVLHINMLCHVTNLTRLTLTRGTSRKYNTTGDIIR